MLGQIQSNSVLTNNSRRQHQNGGASDIILMSLQERVRTLQEKSNAQESKLQMTESALQEQLQYA